MGKQKSILDSESISKTNGDIVKEQFQKIMQVLQSSISHFEEDHTDLDKLEIYID